MVYSLQYINIVVCTTYVTLCLPIYQAVESPTHIMGNVLDVVLTNSADLLTNVIPSDHFCIELDVNLPSRKLTHSHRKNGVLFWC